MEARYSNIPPPHSSTPDLLPEAHDPPNASSRDNGTVKFLNMFGTWTGALLTLWALVAHFILSVGVTLFVLTYVKDNYFNATERTPFVQIIGEKRPTSFKPLQSDIVTIISALIAVLKCALAAWAGSLCWHIALFLMERRGFAHRNLKTLLSYGVLAPGAYSRNWSTWVVGTLLLACLAANLASSVLTGSIGWVPMNRLVHVSPIPFVGFKEVNKIEDLIDVMNETERNHDAIRAMNTISLGWGRNLDKGVVKRVEGSVEELSVNSTIEDLILPHFKVHSIRWIENHDEIPGLKDGATLWSMLRSTIDLGPIKVPPGVASGSAVLVPNIPINWTSDLFTSTTPRTVHEKRLLGLVIGRSWPSAEIEENDSIRDLLNARIEEMGIYYVFAWVEFSAGVGYCRNHGCTVSSRSTIQSDAPIQVHEHPLTSQALVMAPGIGVLLAEQNTALPNLWKNVSDYVEAVLVRSYSGSWMTLNRYGATAGSISGPSYTPSLLSLHASVDQTRVYIWLGLQLLVTLFSILFLIARSNLSKYPLKGDTSLTAFYLDTTEVPEGGDETPPEHIKLLRVESEGGRFKVKLE